MPVPPSRDHVERVAGTRERDRVRFGLAAGPAVGRAHLGELLRRGRVRHVVEEEVFVPRHHQVAVEHGRLIEVSPSEQRRRDQALLPLRLLQVRRRRRLRRVLDRSGGLLEGRCSAGASARRARRAAAPAGTGRARRAGATAGTRRARRAPSAVRSRGRLPSRPSRPRRWSRRRRSCPRRRRRQPARHRCPPLPPVPPPLVMMTPVPAVDPPVVPAAPLVEPAVPGPAPEPLPADPLTPPPVPALLDPPLPEPLPGSDPAHAPSTAARETVSRHASTKGRPGALTLCMGTSWVGGTVPTNRRAVHATSKNGSHVPPQFPPAPAGALRFVPVSHF